MTEQQAQAHRERLLEMGKRLNGDVAGLRDEALRGTGGDASGNLSNAPMHLADLANNNFEQEVAAGLLQNEQQVLGAISAALDRLDAGTFGRCEECGRDLPEGRLQALPYASRCVACAERFEREEGVDLGQGDRVRAKSSNGSHQEMALPGPQLPRPAEAPNTGAETVPPGATPQAHERPIAPRRKGPNDDAEPERTMDDPGGGEKAG